jgi:hypothetical protein
LVVIYRYRAAMQEWVLTLVIDEGWFDLGPAYPDGGRSEAFYVQATCSINTRVGGRVP